MKTVPSLIAAALLTLVLGGCSNDPYPPARDRKIMYEVLREDPHSLDPVQAGDVLSESIISQMYEGLYEYHYLKRPYELKPRLAAAMPEISDDGLTYTIQMKEGVLFHDDPCFVATDGRGREVTAHDVVYQIKRLADQGTRPRGWWLLQGKVVGLDAWHEESVEKAAANEPMNYDRSIEGVRALDDHTLQIRLTEPFPQLKYALSMSYTAAVPREAVEFYGPDIANHPVGSGAFRLKEWHKRWKLILERNPNYRTEYYPDEGEPGDREAGLLDAAGGHLPFVDEVHFTIIYEAQPAWIYFLQGYRDTSGISKDHFDQAITSANELSEEFREKGVRLTKMPEMQVNYVAFNMQDPLLGENKALRQAMSLAFDTQWRIDKLLNGRAIPAQGPIPPGMFGYDPDFRNPYKGFDLDEARERLADAGYPDGVGPDDEQLEITYDIGRPGPAAIQSAQAFADDMAEIGIRVNIETNTWAEFLRKGAEGRLQVFGIGWVLDYPDPENFLQLFYGPRKSPGPNRASYQNPEYDRLFDKMKAMPNGPERLAIIRRMVDMVVEDAVWIPSYHPVTYTLYHAWVKNFKPTGMTGGFLKYRDIDVDMRRRLQRQWNRPNYLPVAVVLGVALTGACLLAAFGRGRTRGRRPEGGRT